MKTSLVILRRKIKGLSDEGCRLRRKINKAKLSLKNNLWDRKREVGIETRLHLLAYAYIKGKKYRDIEPKSNLYFFLYQS